MNICIHSTYTCTFDDFMAQVEKTRPQWSAFVDKHHIAKVDDHSSIMIMKVNDFEAMGAMMSSDEMKAWDAENGCVDVIYNMEEMTEWPTLLEKVEHSEVQRMVEKMEFVTISHLDVPEVTDQMMEEAKQKFMPLILATGADNGYMVRTSDSSVSVVTHFPNEDRGKAAMDKISAVREKAAEHFAMTLNSAHAGACLSS